MVAVSVASAYTSLVALPAVSVRKTIVAVSVGSEYSNAVVYPAEFVSGMYVDESAPPDVHVEVEVEVKVTVAVVRPIWLMRYEVKTDSSNDLAVDLPCFFANFSRRLLIPTPFAGWIFGVPIFWWNCIGEALAVCEG